MIFKELTFANREEWLAWRHQGIGSSDAAVVMGVSRFKEIEDLIEEKALPSSGEDQSNSYIKDRGNKIEVQVRKFLEEKYGHTFTAMSCESTWFNFQTCTLDGISPDKKIICEIKLLSSVNPAKINKEAEGYIKWDKARQGEVPREYYPQIQHQLMITEADYCLFVGYKEVKGNYEVTEDKLAIVKVYPNEDYIEDLMKKEFIFWYKVSKRYAQLTYKEGELE